MELKALRGAVNFRLDTAEEIEARTEELFGEIIGQNKLDVSLIVCVMFSLTSDITAAYPAETFRKKFSSAVPLFSSLEPNIAGGMPLTLRVLVLHYGQISKPVYLYETANLRKDLFFMNIAIDGPSGAGKSTLAKLLAKKLGITYLDTGAMYRALGLKAHKCGVDIGDENAVKALLSQTTIDVKSGENGTVVLLDGYDVSEEIRQNYVSKLASDISAIECVRTFLVDLQRKIASLRPSVLDGRDIGTVVLPDAKFKFYLTASVEARAHRRYVELSAKGQVCDEAQIREDMIKRDYNDTHRKHSPLRKADDAVEIDSTNLTIDEMLNKMLEIIGSRK